MVSSCRLVFGIMSIVDNANVIIETAFNCDIIISSSFLSSYFEELLGDGTVEVVTVWNCYIYSVCFSDVVKVTMSGLLLWVGRLVIMDLS